MQAELARILSDGTEAVIRHQPGFVAVSIHSSLDGTRVVNYAQWRSGADWDSFLKKYREQFAAFGPLSERIDPHLYEVVYLYERAGS